MNSKLITTFFLIIFISSFSVIAQNHVYYNDLEDENMEGNWLGLTTIDSVAAYSGSYFSKTDSLSPYGLGIEQSFPNELVRENTMVLISGYVKSSAKNNRAMFVVTLINGAETLLWKGIPLAPVFVEENTWYYFSDSILIPANLTVNTKLKAYLWNQDKTAATGIDELRIEFLAVDNPTFIPAFADELSEINGNTFKKILFSNSYYSVQYETKENGISIISNTDNTIINDIFFHSKRNLEDEIYISEVQFDFDKSKNIKNGQVLIFSISEPTYKLELVLICNNYSHEIQFEIEEKYKKNQTVNRESIVIDYAQPLTEVYRNNRKLDADYFQDEYWLDKQGVKIGEEQNSFILYHTPNISSLQLDTENNLLFANLDFETDHPFFRFPLNTDSSNWKLDESTSKYKKGDKRKYNFSIVMGNKVQPLPRFMKNPSGFEATYIWSEHADFTDIKTNRATYFGSEKITNADSAVGGFVMYNIPVTKSVFYDNPDSITNFKASNGAFPSLESTILTDTLFSEFLFQISEKGNDICLHTPEQFTTTPGRLEEALSYMQTNFGSPSWIDHGNNNGPLSNREDLICDGTLEDSPYYAIDLWNKYGVNYLHNAYYEELSTYKGWQFESSMEKPYSGFGDFFPKPDYYQHPSRSSNMIHWTTTSALFIKEPYLWDYLFNIKKLQSLIDNRAVEINHTYPPWVNPKKGMWTYDVDSVIIAQPGLNMALANMAHLRDEGKLNVCTIANFLDYRTSIDNIEYDFLPDGRIRLSNNGTTDIFDLAMVSKAKAVSINGIIPNYKIVDNEIIFWFDLAVGASKTIRIVR
ncbi:MAG: hypothetical protein QM503_09775 [Bacteroidota bacterium]